MAFYLIYSKLEYWLASEIGIEDIGRGKGRSIKSEKE